MSFELFPYGKRIVVRDPAFDQRSRTELLRENVAEELIDEDGRSYEGFFDGRNTQLRARNEHFQPARWVLGTTPMRIRGGGPLDPRFLFTFFDHGPSAQRLNALWEFAGKANLAIAAFKDAGFSQSPHDPRFKADEKGRTHLRTRGAPLTGADSSHAIVYGEQNGRTTGEIHVGEHNPMRGLGIGFLLHQWEIRRK